MTTNTASRQPSPPPAWRMPIMWVVVGGPLIVVVAAISTAYIAFKNADPTLHEAPTSAEVARSTARERGDAPAELASRHAATPVAPDPGAQPATAPGKAPR